MTSSYRPSLPLLPSLSLSSGGLPLSDSTHSPPTQTTLLVIRYSNQNALYRGRGFIWEQPCVCMCACVCVCACMRACVCACVRACVHACMRAYVRVCAGVQACVQASKRVCMRVYAHVCMCTCVDACMCGCICGCQVYCTVFLCVCMVYTRHAYIWGVECQQMIIWLASAYSVPGNRLLPNRFAQYGPKALPRSQSLDTVS